VLVVVAVVAANLVRLFLWNAAGSQDLNCGRLGKSRDFVASEAFSTETSTIRETGSGHPYDQRS